MKRAWLVSLLLIPGFAHAQTLQQQIQTAFNRLQQDTQCRYASVSLTVLDAKTGEQVFTANPNMGLAPGSTMKAITSITALNVLGKDYRFKTAFSYRGTITADGTLNGDVIIRGYGDPTLGSWRWETTKEAYIRNQFVAAIRKAGIKKINGRVIGDDSFFGTQSIPDGWIYQDLGTYYGAGTTPLCWHENQFSIRLRTGEANTPIGVTGTSPEMPYLAFKSELVNGEAHTGDQAYPYLPTINSNIMYLRGTYAVDQTKKKIDAAIPDPAFDIAYRLTDTLQRLGITVSSTPESATTLKNKNQPIPQSTAQLLTINSPLLTEILYWQNHISINLYAEQLLLAVIPSPSTMQVTTNNGVTALQNFWAKKAGIDKHTLNVFDGSGLAPGNRVTTLTMSRILQSAAGETWFKDFYDSLPVYNNIHMKSGSINSAQAYTGYQTHDGRQLCFSIIVNNYNGTGSGIRAKMFKVLDELK
ncbi:D-alanyl-D-alanine carboxypeptidase/D-alanyl-D-alanine-endopeptidase [Mucilaginibacter sp. ZB1P21]|uniref:D-alanyl-D-alanine carboxypeptidase/D-alanyl-D-alanine-endopeptidase n=2 Tax=Mucilaginibacter glaciei TaxID=2772109 RepID=A0A926NMI2_9SPHI|nr:D-alanyl-D-alanine carboxypeptidase/D-alanyl-D-alanine-endopeptidase [Mucilaginibacter glaciei]